MKGQTVQTVINEVQLLTTLAKPLANRTIKLQRVTRCIANEQLVTIALNGTSYDYYVMTVQGIRCEGGAGCYIVDCATTLGQVSVFVRFAR